MRKWFVTIKIQFSISAKSPQESCRVCVRPEMDPSSDRCQELLIKIWLPGKSCSNSAYVQKCGPCVWIPQGKHTKGIKKMCKKMPSVAHVPNGKTCMFHIYADWRPEIAMTVLFAHEFTSLAQMLQCYFLGPAACSALETPGSSWEISLWMSWKIGCCYKPPSTNWMWPCHIEPLGGQGGELHMMHIYTYNIYIYMCELCIYIYIHMETNYTYTQTFTYVYIYIYVKIDE